MPRPASSSLRHTARLIAVGTVALAAAAVAPPARADGGPITLQTATVAPIDATNRVCTAEPRGLIYGTKNYNAGLPLSYTSEGFPAPGYYVPANAPSAIDLVPAVLAGARSDLCLAATLPPDAEAPLIRLQLGTGDRLQDTPPWPDIPETHVVADVPGDPAPQGDDLASLRIDLPPGQGLAFASQTTCSDAQFGVALYLDPACPAHAQIGDGLLRLSVWHQATASHLVLPSAKAYALEHGPNELARIGLSAKPLPSLAPIKLVFRATLLPSGQIRLVASDIPRTLFDTADVEGDGTLAPSATALPTYLESFGLRLWGSQFDHPSLSADFAATTTSCGEPATGAVHAETASGTSSDLVPDALTASGCGGLGYDPQVSLDLGDPRPGVPSAATIDLKLGGDDAGRLPARTSVASVALPDGLRLGGQIGSGDLAFCSSEAFGADSSAAPSCPDASTVGLAVVSGSYSSLPLVGEVHLAAPRTDGDLAALLIDAAPDGATAPDAPRIKFVGRLIDTAGRLTVRFDDLPALPLGDVAISFRGGDHALLTTPDACGELTTTADFTTPSGLSTQTTSEDDTVDGDCATPATAPTVEVRTTTPQPGSRDGVRLSITRQARSSALTSVNASLPEGVLVDLRGVATCAAAAVAAGECGERPIGTVHLSIGAGSAPADVAGSIYLTPPSAAGVSSALARVPVRLGPLDLGVVTVPIAIGFDSGSRRLALAAFIPKDVDDVPLDIREIGVELASGIAVNPTACGPLPLAADVVAADGSKAAATSELALSGCAGQPLAPALQAGLSGESAAGGHPKAVISLQGRAGDANLDAWRLSLPAGLELDPAHPTCDAAAFAAGSCGATGRLGAASIGSGVADAPVGGDLHLVRVAGKATPSIGLTVGGDYAFRTLGDTSTVAGRVVVDFGDLPDLPITRIDLAFDGGAAGALRVRSAVCTSGADWRATLRGQGGQAATATTPVTCSAGVTSSSANGPKIELSVKAKTGLKLKINQFGGRRLQSAKLTLSPRLKFKPPVARRGKNVSLVVIGPKAKSTISSRSLAVSLGAGALPQEVAIRVRWPAMTLSPRGHRKSSFRLRLAFTDGTVVVRDVLVTLPAK